MNELRVEGTECRLLVVGECAGIVMDCFYALNSRLNAKHPEKQGEKTHLTRTQSFIPTGVATPLQFLTSWSLASRGAELGRSRVTQQQSAVHPHVHRHRVHSRAFFGRETNTIVLQHLHACARGW